MEPGEHFGLLARERSSVDKLLMFLQCSVSCGEGQQNREILCKATYSRATLPFSECDLPSRPVETMSCTMPGCPAASSSTHSNSSDRVANVSS